jgi:hypothetical protein
MLEEGTFQKTVYGKWFSLCARNSGTLQEGLRIGFRSGLRFGVALVSR